MFNAGDLVEVIDPTNRLYGVVGAVEFFVDDNVYVRFPKRRWRSLRMFFVRQLRSVTVQQQSPVSATAVESAGIASTQA